MSPIEHRARRALLRLAVGLLSLLALLFVALQLAVYVLLPGGIYAAPNADREPDPRADVAPAALRALGLQHLRVEVGPPPASLSLFRVDPPRGVAHASLLVFHGIRDSKRSLIAAGRRLAAAGYRVFLIDGRGHGRSSGRYLTYGVREARDAQQVLDALTRRQELQTPVGALGFSYGGAVAIQLAARDPRVVAVVSVSAFASLRRVVPSYVRLAAPGLGALVLPWVIDRGVAEAGRVAGFDPAAADTEAAIRRATRARFLLLHGGADRHIPVLHAHRLATAAGSRAELRVFAAETHASILADPRGEVQRATDAFLARWLARP